MKKIIAWGLVYAVLAAMALGASPWRGETVGPFDLLASASGWNPDGTPVEVRHRERSDIVDALLPGWLEARRQLRSGQFPLWNPLPAGGTPAMLDPMSTELTPGFLMFAAAPDPAFGFYLSVLGCLVVAGLGMHLFVSRHAPWWVALFAGSSYMLCGFITAWLYWPHTHTAIWIPWLLLAVDIFSSRGSLRAFVGIALATALMLVAGFPFVAVIGIGAALVHAAVTGAMQGRAALLRAPAGVLAAMLLGAMLAAVPLLTFAASLGDADLGYRRGGSGLSPRDWRLLLGPWLNDKPRVESNMYPGLLALVLAPLGLVAALRPRRNPLAWSGALLLLVGVVLVFGLLPLELGRQLPVLSNNPWHRAILLLGIAIVLLAAVGLQAITAGKRTYAWVVVAIAACTVQFVDLRTHFERFNGPTPARYFYAERPALADLRERLGPFEYVAVDNAAYLVSGTQGGAGIPDWFAHAFRSAPLHQLLDDMAENPFASATATAMGIERYHWRSNLLDVVALCYGLYPNSKDVLPVAARAQGAARQALPPINGVVVEQPLRLDRPLRVPAVSIMLATYRATDLDGSVTVDVLRKEGGPPLATASIPGASVRDNRMAMFRFHSPVDLPDGEYLIQLRYQPGPKRRNLTAWLFSDGSGQVIRDGATVPGSLDYLVHEESEGDLQPVFRDDAITVASNAQCAGGAYWLPGLDDAGEQRRLHEAVTIESYSPADSILRVRAPAADGFAVVPMRWLPGWQATVDGEEASVSLLRGVLPAVAVPEGESTVRLHYSPPGWRFGLALMLFALVALAWIWRAHRPDTAPTIGSSSTNPTKR